MQITNSFLVDAIILFTTALLTFIAYVKWRYRHWARVGLDYVEPRFPFGNFWGTARQKTTFGEEMEHHYFQLKSKGVVKHAGFYFFHSPIYVPFDPEIIKHIMQVDFSNFVDRGSYYNEESDPLSAHLFSLEGTKWRNLRAKLSPTFTSGKMKMMFPLVLKSTEELTGVLDKFGPNEPTEFKDILARLTTDIIGTCAFGLDCNSLHDPNAEFRKQGKKFFQSTGWERLVRFLCFIYPDTMKRFKARVTPKVIENFFMGVVHDTVSYREKNNVERKDFMQLLINLKNIGAVSEEEANITSMKVSLTDNELAAQAFLFFLAGFETSSTTMSFCLYEVAQNEKIQQKMRDEINAVIARHGGKFTYEAMLEMTYMENVINETLRIYPPVPNLPRKCIKDYKIPGTDVVLHEGDRIFIPVQALQHDPEHYPNPKVFDPDRFSEEIKRTRHPFTFLPFGEGPRICIGLRFGVMQTKVGLAILLRNYKFKLNSRTAVPMVFDPKALVNSAIGGIWMNMEKIPQANK